MCGLYVNLMRCVFELRGFRSKFRPKMRQCFRTFCKIQIKTYFSASVQCNDYNILVLAIIVESTDIKSVFRKCVNGLF